MLTELSFDSNIDTENIKYQCLYRHNYSFKEILDQIHAGFDKKGPTIKAGSFLLNTALFLNSFLPISPKITKAMVRSSLSKTYFSNLKLVKALNFNFQPLKDCISSTCKFYSSSN